MADWNVFWAHSPNDDGKPQTMEAHLHEVAQMARDFAEPFGAGDFAHWVGWLHDVGKFSDEFQGYMRRCHLDKVAGKKGKTTPGGGDHKEAGTRLASQLTGRQRTEAGVLVLGHHGGMPPLTDAVIIPTHHAKLDEVIACAQKHIPYLGALPAHVTLPPAAGTSKNEQLLKREREMFLRMAFSCLVDADSLDTERHFNATSYAKRETNVSLQHWKHLLDAKQASLQANAQSNVAGKALTVNQVRSEVYGFCAAGSEPQAAFSLTVPTGGGKTLSSLAFALAHAIDTQHPLDRIIYAIPYTSIIDQTASVFRELLGEEAPLLVHHSALPEDPREDDGKGETSWRRLVSQNWDAPLVVTTTVQLFESLFSNTPSRCRKLHNLANSVIILDEAQMLPVSLLEPILDGLKLLIKHYHTTVVFCTATQPAFDILSKHLSGFKNIQPIVPVEAQKRHFEVMKRVTYRIEPESWDWSQVAAAIRKDDIKQCLAIVNTRADAISLLDALDDPEAFHLSTLLCGAHRELVLRQVRQRLKAGYACRLVSTQVIECGVDVDFQRVFRAVGPLDRLVQAAGRCNREGLHESGEVIIFLPAEGKIPPGEYRSMVAETKMLLQDSDLDFHDPDTYTRYFQALYGAIDTDKRGIQKLRQEMDFPEVARQFRMIEQDTRPVLVCYAPKEELFAQIRDAAQSGRMTRELWRKAQPLLVNLYTHDIERAKKAQKVQDAIPNSPDTLYLWTGEYDDITHRGLVGLFDDPADPVYRSDQMVV